MKHVCNLGMCQRCGEAIISRFGMKEHTVGNASALTLHRYRSEDELPAA